MQSLTHASVFSLLTVLIGLAPMVMGVAYAIRPSEQRLAVMRPLSLASIFAALSGMMAGLMGALVAMGMADDASAKEWHRTASGLAEALVPPFLTFAFLAVAWIAVALGMRRTDRV
ncbi:MAG TPA: hypothetical protein VJN96_22670 [Vicinamibacterales bacterium]|nr:hypothetical protein [Vicinamibacterales bacterium]